MPDVPGVQREMANTAMIASDQPMWPGRRCLRRLLVDQRDGVWYIVDPLFSEWLRRASPLADRPGLEARKLCMYRSADTLLDLYIGT
jgi:hypothetical protein